jgi:hypothetical protein
MLQSNAYSRELNAVAMQRSVVPAPCLKLGACPLKLVVAIPHWKAVAAKGQH